MPLTEPMATVPVSAKYTDNRAWAGLHLVSMKQSMFINITELLEGRRANISFHWMVGEEDLEEYSEFLIVDSGIGHRLSSVLQYQWGIHIYLSWAPGGKGRLSCVPDISSVRSTWLHTLHRESTALDQGSPEVSGAGLPSGRILWHQSGGLRDYKRTQSVS